MRKRHIVVLSEEERARLHTMIGRGVAPASALTHRSYPRVVPTPGRPGCRMGRPAPAP